MADDDEVGLPQKGINLIIKDVLPDVRVANETRELLNQCCVEFVKHVAKEAQFISSKDQRKTIYHDHVQKALENMGFSRDYIEAANSVLGECKMAAEKRLRRKNSRLDKCGIPEEELYLMQQELIERARKEEAEKQAAQISAHFGDGGAVFSYPLFPLFGGQQQNLLSPVDEGSSAMSSSSMSTTPTTADSSSSAVLLPPIAAPPFPLPPTTAAFASSNNDNTATASSLSLSDQQNLPPPGVVVVNSPEENISLVASAPTAALGSSGIQNMNALAATLLAQSTAPSANANEDYDT